jgi:hypothetical protein
LKQRASAKITGHNVSIKFPFGLQQPNSKSLFCFKIDILILIGSFLFFGLQIIREETLLAETIS